MRRLIEAIVFMSCMIILSSQVAAEEFPTPKVVEYYINHGDPVPWMDFVMPADSFTVSVKEALMQNPDLMGMVYYDYSSKRWIPYFNIGPGIGKAFQLVPGLSYKILARKPTLLVIQEVMA